MRSLCTLMLLLIISPLYAYERPEDGPMTSAQSETLRTQGLTVVITDVNDRALSKKAVASYEAILKNPFTRGIICNLSLTSSQDEQNIETKIHSNVYAPARSAHKIRGEIEIRRGKKGNDGLQWMENKGSAVTTSDCRFVD